MPRRQKGMRAEALTIVGKPTMKLMKPLKA